MSGTHTPATSEFSASGLEGSPRSRTTRTVAIIKNHALEHRLSIERRIEEASFEIVKERQMEFDQNSDQDFLHELFGIDMPSLFEGPVWVYVLERRRAVEVFNALMGEADPERAREKSPNSLRALFGIDHAQNAIMASPDEQTAEEQIVCLFQSSPPFPAQDLAEGEDLDDVENQLGVRLDAEEWQERINGFVQSPSVHSESGSRRGGSSVTSNGSGSKNGARLSANGKPAVPFKARPIPRTTLVPDIAPRITKAAALRAGIPVAPSRSDRPRVAPTKEELKKTFLDVPGHKRSNTIQVASTAPPTVAPRMTRAASLRINAKADEAGKPKPRPKTQPLQRPKSSSGAIFEGVPGHKRRETITVASVQAPTVAPRLNKSAELRVKKDAAPPSSFMFKGPSTPKTPGGLSRTPSQSSFSPSRPSSSMANLSSGTPSGRQSSMARLNSQTSVTSTASGSSQQDENDEPAAVRLMPPRPPSIEPRTNRSALLRANKLGGQGSAPPSSMRKLPVTVKPAGSRAI